MGLEEPWSPTWWDCWSYVVDEREFRWAPQASGLWLNPSDEDPELVYGALDMPSVSWSPTFPRCLVDQGYDPNTTLFFQQRLSSAARDAFRNRYHEMVSERDTPLEVSLVPTGTRRRPFFEVLGVGEWLSRLQAELPAPDAETFPCECPHITLHEWF